MTLVGNLHIGAILPIVTLPIFTKGANSLVLLFLLCMHFHWIVCENYCSISWVYKKFTGKNDLKEAFGKYHTLMVVCVMTLYWSMGWKLIHDGGMKPSYLYALVFPIIAARTYGLLGHNSLYIIAYLTFAITHHFQFTKDFTIVMLLFYSGKESFNKHFENKLE